MFNILNDIKLQYHQFACSGYLRHHGVNPTHVCQIVAIYLDPVIETVDDNGVCSEQSLFYIPKLSYIVIENGILRPSSELSDLTNFANKESTTGATKGFKSFQLLNDGTWLFGLNAANQLHYRYLSSARKPICIMPGKPTHLTRFPYFNPNPASSCELIICGNERTVLISEYQREKHVQRLLGIGYYNLGQFGVPKSRIDTLDIRRPFEGIQYISYTDKVATAFLDKNDHIVDMKLGLQHSVFLTQSGGCYACGKFDFGQCGIDPNKLNSSKSQDDSKEATKDVEFEKKIVYAPQRLVFTSDADMNDTGSKRNRKRRNRVNMIKKIACGDYHTLCLDWNDNVWAFGVCPGKKVMNINNNSNENAEVVDANKYIAKEPVLLDLESVGDIMIVDIEANKNYSLLMDDEYCIHVMSEFDCKGNVLFASKINLMEHFGAGVVKNSNIGVSCDNFGFIVYWSKMDVLGVDFIDFENIERFVVSGDGKELKVNEADLKSNEKEKLEWDVKKNGTIVGVASRGDITLFATLK